MLRTYKVDFVLTAIRMIEEGLQKWVVQRVNIDLSPIITAKPWREHKLTPVILIQNSYTRTRYTERGQGTRKPLLITILAHLSSFALSAPVSF